MIVASCDNMTNIVKIEDIENAPNKKLQINFEEFISEINSNEPIRALLEAVVLGNFIQISGNVQGKVILVCDLCLEEFAYEINIEINELFAKDTLLDEYGQETEIKENQFVVDLYGDKNIDIYDLLYQSVILDFPNKKVCGIKCKGDKFLSENNFTQSEVDPRLAVFKEIKIQNNNKKSK
jgi:uncharacterized protein